MLNTIIDLVQDRISVLNEHLDPSNPFLKNENQDTIKGWKNELRNLDLEYSKLIAPDLELDADEYMMIDSALCFFEENIEQWYKNHGHNKTFLKTLSQKTKRESKKIRIKLSKYANQTSDYIHKQRSTK